MTFDELKELMRVQLPPMGALAEVAGLIVAPDVWARFVAEVPPSYEPAPPFVWTVKVDPWLLAGLIMPVDREGRPILKPPTLPISNVQEEP